MTRNKLGQFVAGPDPARHRLTRRERRLGYLVTMGGGRRGNLSAATVAYVWRRVRSYYRRVKRQGE